MLFAIFLAFAFASWGCSKLIADKGVVRGALNDLQTRAQVRNLLGPADEVSACPDGRAMERFWIRQKIEWWGNCKSNFAAELGCSALGGAYAGTFGLVDIFVLPVTLIRSERAKLHYAFVYDKTDQVLYRFDVAAPALKRFRDVIAPLSEALYGQLKEVKCNNWTACLTEYAREARQRAACVEYTLNREDEERLENIVSLGEAVDAHRVSSEEGIETFSLLTGIKQPLRIPETIDGAAKSGTGTPPQIK